jgi:hypothetical protein
MTAGHFGLAAVVKSSAPRVPLWALMVSTYLLDVVFIVLASAGLESFTPIDPAQPAYGGTLIQAYYSHSLLGAALIAVIAGLLAGRAWGKRAGVVIGAVVFSHWLLDLVVHRPDLPLLPGNLGSLPLLGFGLWQLPAASAVVELALALAGAYLYYRSALRAPALSGQGGQRRNYALIAAGITGLLIVLLLTADVLSLPLLIPVGLMLLLIVLGGWLDSHLNWSLPAT